MLWQVIDSFGPRKGRIHPVTCLFRVTISDLQDKTLSAKEIFLAQLQIFPYFGLLEVMSKTLNGRRYRKNWRRETEMTVPKLNMIRSENSPGHWYQFHIVGATLGNVTEICLVFLRLMLISTCRLSGPYPTYVFKCSARYSGHRIGPCPQVCFFLKTLMAW
jgi:hypothetical protein